MKCKRHIGIQRMTLPYQDIHVCGCIKDERHERGDSSALFVVLDLV